jgi:hypothetical protein
MSITSQARVRKNRMNLCFPERAVKPHPQGAGHSQLVEGFGAASGVGMHRRVARLAESMEQVKDVAGDGAAISQPVEDVGEVVFVGGHDTDVSRRLAGQQVGVLAQADQGERRVLKDEALGLGSVAHKKRVMLGKESEVRRQQGRTFSIGGGGTRQLLTH